MNAYKVKAGWFIPFVDKRVGGRYNCVIPLTRAIAERVRRGYDDALYKSTFTYFTFRDRILLAFYAFGHVSPFLQSHYSALLSCIHASAVTRT